MLSPEEEEDAISASLCDDDSSIADKRYALLLLEYPSLPAEAEDEDEDDSNDDEEEKLKLGKLAARAVTLMSSSSSFLFHLLEKWRLWCCRSKRRPRRKQERADKALEAAAGTDVVVVIFTRARGCVL